MHSSSSTTAGGVRKGAWTEEEDRLLRNCIDNYGEGKWHQVPHRAGLNRCRKSCRLRWLNYLRPNIKRGNFGLDEVDLIMRLHKLLGNRWSLIAGRLPGRTANDVKNYWNTHMKKKEQINNNNEGRMRGRECTSCGKTTTTTTTEAPKTTIVKPRPRSFSKNSPWSLRQQMMIKTADVHIINVDQNPPSNHEVVPKVPQSSSSSSLVVPADHHHHHHEMQWLENLFNEENVISACSPLTDDRISNMWSEETWCGFGFGFGFGFGAEEGRGNNNNNHDEQNYFANILN